MVFELIRDCKGLLEFYSDLFSSTNTCQLKLAMEVIPTIVTDDMNKLLLAEFKEGKEIGRASCRERV